MWAINQLSKYNVLGSSWTTEYEYIHHKRYLTNTQQTVPCCYNHWWCGLNNEKSKFISWLTIAAVPICSLDCVSKESVFCTLLQVSRLQTALDIAREVYNKVRGELRKPFEDYLLYWPQQKVGSTMLRPFRCQGLDRIEWLGILLFISCSNV